MTTVKLTISYVVDPPGYAAALAFLADDLRAWLDENPEVLAEIASGDPEPVMCMS